MCGQSRHSECVRHDESVCSVMEQEQGGRIHTSDQLRERERERVYLLKCTADMQVTAGGSLTGITGEVKGRKREKENAGNHQKVSACPE